MMLYYPGLNPHLLLKCYVIFFMFATFEDHYHAKMKLVILYRLTKLNGHCVTVSE